MQPLDAGRRIMNASGTHVHAHWALKRRFTVSLHHSA